MPHMPRFAALALVAFGLALPGVAGAHARLVDPEPITDDDNAKSGPCGCFFNGAPEDPTEDVTPLACPGQFTVTELEPGQTITVVFEETVNHNGDFRLSFSDLTPAQVTKAEMDLAANVLYDEPDAVAGGTVMATVTLPDVECNPCTLQLRQFMEGASTPYYYSCAALRLVAPSQGGAGGGGAGGGAVGGQGGEGGVGGASVGGSSLGGQNTGNVGNTAVDPSTGAGPAPTPITLKSGCSLGGTGGSVGFLLVVCAAALAGALRRRR